MGGHLQAKLVQLTRNFSDSLDPRLRFLLTVKQSHPYCRCSHTYVGLVLTFVSADVAVAVAVAAAAAAAAAVLLMWLLWCS